MLTDKYKATKNLRRIPEKVLMWSAVLGGSLGCLVGMYTVRHKTRHIKFTIGIHLISVVQFITLIFLL